MYRILEPSEELKHRIINNVIWAIENIETCSILDLIDIVAYPKTIIPSVRKTINRTAGLKYSDKRISKDCFKINEIAFLNLSVLRDDIMHSNIHETDHITLSEYFDIDLMKTRLLSLLSSLKED